MAEQFIQSINGCARCHGDGHKDLVFKPFTHPIRAGTIIGSKDDVELEVEATHWATCPTNGEPILLAMVERGDDDT